MLDLAGTTLGQYELLELLEDNTIIRTYRAVQQSLKRPVAVHVLNRERGDYAVWREALVTGVGIAARFEHPNIVPVIDYGIHDGIDYVVLRLVEGGTLYKRLEQGALGINEAAGVVRQIASALDYVHAQGHFHGDPAAVNIIFDTVGNAYIAEFYLAGLLHATYPGLVAGVLAYLAPERRDGQPPTPQTDQFALAGVAYHMLTGTLAWESRDQPRHLAAVPPLQQHRPDIPTAVNAVLWRALAFDPADRFPTVTEFARQFETALSSTPQHLFVSYSRKDGDFVAALKEHLLQNGLQVWIDNHIEHGDQWFNQINDAIRTCAAFLVVMSPDSEASEWVQKEVLLAKRYKKPIFPLLLRGDEFPLLIDLQFADVRGGEMPNPDFHRRVTRTIYGQG
jgi:serine/threonine-protein kinase